MSKHFFQSALARSALLSAYRVYAQSQFFTAGTRIFVNSIPKAGTHLLTTTLDRVPSAMNSRLHIDISELRAKDGGRYLSDFVPDLGVLRKKLSSVRPGQFATGHLPWREGVFQCLMEADFKVIFVTRNPDAILRSRLSYIMGLRRHPLHRQLMESADTEQDRLQLLRDGMPYQDARRPGTDPFPVYIDQFRGWSEYEHPCLLIVPFEALAKEKQAEECTPEREKALADLIAFANPGSISVERLHLLTRDRKSVTYRSGGR